MPTFSLPQPVPPPKKSETSTNPADTPSGARPTSYDDAFRGREAHSKFADPCAQAREVREASLEAIGRVEGTRIDEELLLVRIDRKV